MDSKPFVSIVMATYNGEKYIKKQLDSILNQTYSNFELIICDDCSTDNTRHILEYYSKKDDRVRLIFNNKNLGVTKNFEQGIKLTKGDYIAIADQDDIWREDKLEILLKEIKNNILIYHDNFLIDEKDNIIYNSYFKFLRRKNFNIKSVVIGNIIGDNFISGHSMLFISELKKYLFPFPEKRYINYYDYWIVLVAIKLGMIKKLDKSLVYWRQHSNNDSGNKIIKNDHIKFKNIQLLKYKWRLNRIRTFIFLKKFYKGHFLEKYVDNLLTYECNENKIESVVFLLKEYKNLFPTRDYIKMFKKLIKIPFTKVIKCSKIERIINDK